MSEGMTCYDRDEMLCEDQMCLRVDCRIRNARLQPAPTYRVVRWGFKSKKQLPFFMVLEEFWERSEVVHANVLFSSRDWIGL